MPETVGTEASEAARMVALQRYAILDTEAEPAFDRLVRLAAHSAATSLALISLVDGRRVWFKATLGIALTEIPRADSLMTVTIDQGAIMVVPDIVQDGRFTASPLVLGAPHARFYASVPLTTVDGHAVGALSVMDPTPRPGLTPAQELALRDLAAMVMDLLELRYETAQRERLMGRARLRERLLASNAEAATSQAAIDAAIGVVHEASGSMLCLLFRTAPDGRQLQLLGGRTDCPEGDAVYLDALRALDFSMDNSLCGRVIRGGSQGFFHHFTPNLLALYPGVKLSAQHGARAQLVTPIRLGEDRCAVVLSFRDEPADIDHIKALMEEVASTLRPLLRRLRDEEAAQLFQRAVDASADAVIISDAEPAHGPGPCIRYVNQAFMDQTGYSAAEVLGRTPQILDGPDTSDAARRFIRASLAQRIPVRQEILTYRRDGTSFWADLHIAPVADGTGWFTHWVAIQRDVTERIRAEQVVRDLADELKLTLESISDGFFSLDAQWRFRYVNARAQRLLRLPGTAVSGVELATVLSGADHAALVAHLREIQGKAACARFLHRDATADRWLDITGYPTPTGGLTVYLRDVTAQRKSEERLRLLEAVVDQLNDVILITEATPIDGPGPRIVFANGAFERMTGYTSAEVLGQTPRLLQGRNTDPAELRRIGTALRSWSPIRSELLNYTKAGTEYWVEMDIVPVADEKGWYSHWVAVERDITERKLAQIKLEEQAALLDQSRDAIMVRSMDNRILFWNRSAERLYGWTAQEVHGQSALLLLYPDVVAFNAAREVLLRDGHWAGTLRQRRKNGEMIIVEAHKTLLRNADGTPRAILAVDSDVTERVALEDQLRQAQRMEAVGQLTGGIAHDFNNLLTVILGNAEILLERLDLDSEMQPIAAMTLAAAERGAALTSRLLAFSRQQTLNPRVIDVHELLLGLGALIRRALDERVALALTTSSGLWPALIDSAQLETAVLNLCLNARDAMPLGGRVTIATSNFTTPGERTAAGCDLAAGDYVLIEVSDNGTGMAPDVIARAFEPFFTTKDVGKGSGLGLSMVYGFAKQSGGHVSIESEPDEGTSVRVYIPRARAAVEPLPERPAPEVLRGGTERVLLVEDDALVREHSARQLRKLGYRVELAEDGAEALDVLAHQGEFDLLFTDIVMPGGMAGHELARQALILRPGLRVLFSSGYTEQSGAHAAWFHPGMLLLPKPYRLRDLAEKVRQALD